MSYTFVSVTFVFLQYIVLFQSEQEGGRPVAEKKKSEQLSTPELEHSHKCVPVQFAAQENSELLKRQQWW